MGTLGRMVRMGGAEGPDLRATLSVGARWRAVRTWMSRRSEASVRSRREVRRLRDVTNSSRNGSRM